MSDEFRQWIVAELARLGWSHRELSRRTNVSRALISRVIAGDMRPTCEFLVTIATELDVAPTYLLTLAGLLPGEPTPADPGPITAEIISLVESLPPEKRKQVLEYLRWFSTQP